MTIRMAAQAIRDQVTMQQVIDFYGYRQKHGFMCCPFHGEKAPSLKIYPETGGWHCFGCGKGGSVIDFVMEQEGCGFPDAVRAIDRAFGLRLMEPDENPFRAHDEQRRQEWLDHFAGAVRTYCETVIAVIERQQLTDLRMVQVLEAKRDADPQSVTPEEWNLMDEWKEFDQYNEFRKEKVHELMEEVAAWRRKARRTG